MNASRTLTHRLPFLIGATFSIAASVIAIDGGMYVGQETGARASESPRIGELVTANDCWTGDAPADMVGVVPGHVVVTVDGKVRYAGERMVGKALEQIFDGADHGLTVHAFCR